MILEDDFLYFPAGVNFCLVPPEEMMGVKYSISLEIPDCININTSNTLFLNNSEVITKEYLDFHIDNIETALDRIIEIQENLIGGDTV